MMALRLHCAFLQRGGTPYRLYYQRRNIRGDQFQAPWQSKRPDGLADLGVDKIREQGKDQVVCMFQVLSKLRL